MPPRSASHLAARSLEKKPRSLEGRHADFTQIFTQIFTQTQPGMCETAPPEIKDGKRRKKTSL
eukprot:350391-Chlamydomonas_euryale.AAC.10